MLAATPTPQLFRDFNVPVSLFSNRVDSFCSSLESNLLSWQYASTKYKTTPHSVSDDYNDDN